jgi:hypothetical protein
MLDIERLTLVRTSNLFKVSSSFSRRQLSPLAGLNVAQILNGIHDGNINLFSLTVQIQASYWTVKLT